MFLPQRLLPLAVIKILAFLIAVILTVFTILFGARHLDPNERHEGLIAAIAFESIKVP